MTIERTDIANSDHESRVTRALGVSAPSVPEIAYVLTMSPKAPFACVCTCGWAVTEWTKPQALMTIDQHRHLPTNGANP